MAFPRKDGRQGTVGATLDLPDQLPRLPGDVLSRFPSFADWLKQADRWYAEVRLALARRQAQEAEETGSDAVQEQAVDLTSLQNAITGLQTALTTLTNTVANIQSSTLHTRIVPIGTNVSEFTVTGLGLSAAPTIVGAVVIRGTGTLAIWPSLSGITPDGFQVTLSGITDTADYKLSFGYIL